MNIIRGSAPTRARSTLIMATLFLGAFGLGTAELLVVGILNLIATDLAVSIPAAGALVTVNALGLGLGGPVLTALTIRRDKRHVLLGSLAIFVVATLVPVLTADYTVFLVARTVAGAVQGLFIAAAFVAATAIVPAERAGRAMSLVISGIAVSTALGVPVGTLVGQSLGWRGSFLAVVALVVVALVATAALVPPTPSAATGAAGQARHAFAPRVLAVLGLCAAVFAALFGTLTYIEPFLTGITGVNGGTIGVFLLLYGAASAVGSFGGGRFADADAARTLIVGTLGLTAALVVLALSGTTVAAAAAALVGLGVCGMGMGPSLQYRVVSLAGPGGQLASSLPASAINIGIAVGSTLSGLAMTATATPTAAVVTALVIAALAVPAAWASARLTPAGDETTSAPAIHDRVR